MSIHKKSGCDNVPAAVLWIVPELSNVGDGFEVLHGGSPFDGHKKSPPIRWKGGREWGSVRVGQDGCCVDDVVRVYSGSERCQVSSEL